MKVTKDAKMALKQICETKLWRKHLDEPTFDLEWTFDTPEHAHQFFQNVEVLMQMDIETSRTVGKNESMTDGRLFNGMYLKGNTVSINVVTNYAMIIFEDPWLYTYNGRIKSCNFYEWANRNKGKHWREIFEPTQRTEDILGTDFFEPIET